MSPVDRALIKSTFIAGIDNVVAGRLRLLFPNADIRDLPTHAKAIQEAVGLATTSRCGSEVAEQSAEPDQIAALRSEVQTLTAAADAIRLADTGRDRAAALFFFLGGGVAVVALSRAAAGRACSGRRDRLWRGRQLSLTGRRPVTVARPGPGPGGAAPVERAVAVPRVDPRVGRVGSLATCRLVRHWHGAAVD